jgi:hypothetical protein
VDQASLEESGHGVELGHLERLVARHRRQDRRKPPGEHRLARTGWSDHEDVVSSGGRHLECPAGLPLTPDLGEIDRMPRVDAPGRRLRHGRPPRPSQEPDHLPERPRADDLEIVHQRRLGRVRRRHHHASQSRARRSDRYRQHAWGRDQAAPERELARERPPWEPRGRYLRGGREHPQRDRQVEARAFLAERSRRQVHDDATQRPLQARALDRRPDPIARVLHARPRHPFRVSDGSPRPTCASTATRWPRTPTTVTPVTLRERTSPSTDRCPPPILGSMDEEEKVPGVEALSDEELAALVRFVRAVIDHDEAVLRAAGAYDDGGDPYLFTRNWRLWDHVDLVMPPGEPRTWVMDVYRDGNTLPAAIVFDMLTVQEGRSDLTLEVHFVAGANDDPIVRFGGLHVL